MDQIIALNGNITYYNLDMILAIGYRVRSNVGTNFRKWATATLKEYVAKGFALNDDLLKEAVEDAISRSHSPEFVIFAAAKRSSGEE